MMNDSVIDSLTKNSHPVMDGLEMGIGTWAWGDRLYWDFGCDYNEEDLKEAFGVCIQANRRIFFDTSEAYSQGQSEKYLKQFMGDYHCDAFIATKFMSFPWRIGKKSFVKALEASLNRLGLDKIDLYQLQMNISLIPVENWMEFMVEAYREELISAIGVSNFNRDMIQRAHIALADDGVRLASNQIEYSLLNRRAELDGVIRHCQDLGISVLAYSPLAMGILSGKYTVETPPPGFREKRFSRDYLDRMQPLIALLKKIGISHAGRLPAQVALNWVICKGCIPIVGVKNYYQAEQNLGALGWQLTDEEIALLDAASSQILEQ